MFQFPPSQTEVEGGSSRPFYHLADRAEYLDGLCVALFEAAHRWYTMITHTKQGDIDPESVVAFRADLLLLLGKVSNDLLHHACARGHLSAVQVLAEQYPLNARANNNAALRLACTYGHLPVVRYLTEHYGLMAEDARAENNYAMRWGPAKMATCPLLCTWQSISS